LIQKFWNFYCGRKLLSSTCRKKFRSKRVVLLAQIIRIWQNHNKSKLQNKNKEARKIDFFFLPHGGRQKCVLKSCHTSMNHYMQENSRMSPHKSIHSSLFIECKGLQWGPQFDLVCPCKYTMKREIQRGKAIVLASMIHQMCMKANLNDNDSKQCKIYTIKVKI
jgi:hypothetical protein